MVVAVSVSVIAVVGSTADSETTSDVDDGEDGLGDVELSS